MNVLIAQAEKSIQLTEAGDVVSGDDVDLESSEAFSCHAISPHTFMGGDQKKNRKEEKNVFSSLSLVYIQYIFDSAECVSEWRNFIDTAQSTAAAATECCVYGKKCAG